MINPYKSKCSILFYAFFWAFPIVLIPTVTTFSRGGNRRWCSPCPSWSSWRSGWCCCQWPIRPPVATWGFWPGPRSSVTTWTSSSCGWDGTKQRFGVLFRLYIVYIYIYMYIYIHIICVYMYIWLCRLAYMLVCTNIHIYIYTYIHIYIHIYIYTHYTTIIINIYTYMRQNWGYDHYGMLKQTLFGRWDMQAANFCLPHPEWGYNS